MSLETKILIVDDEQSNARMMRQVLGKEGYEIEIACSGAEALRKFKEAPYALVLTDVRMPGMDGIELLAEIRQCNSEIPVLVISGFSEIKSAVECMRLGAVDFLTKPIDLSRLRKVVASALQNKKNTYSNPVDNTGTHKESPREPEGLETLLGESESMKKVYQLIEKVAPYDISLLITGESGTGKEVAAKVIHHLSLRQKGPMVALDCTALPDHLVESELFGYEKGAFTGAGERKLGRLELANGGTLFLDEIGNLNEALQMKLLRVLQERQVTRLGGKEPVSIDVRLLTATNADLHRMMKEGKFREDLFYRISEMELFIPPVRQRGEDVILLARFFLQRYRIEFHRPPLSFTPSALEAIKTYAWPGNVREVQNVLKRAAILAEDAVANEHLPDYLRHGGRQEIENESSDIVIAEDMPPLRQITAAAVEKLESGIIRCALEKTHWNKAKAAKWLKIDYKTLHNKLKEYGIG